MSSGVSNCRLIAEAYAAGDELAPVELLITWANREDPISRSALEGTLHCTNCGNELSSERSALGYSYCTREECVAACFEPVDVVALAVNKASDQYLLRRHLDLPEHPPRPEVDRDTLGALGLSAGRQAGTSACPAHHEPHRPTRGRARRRARGRVGSRAAPEARRRSQREAPPAEHPLPPIGPARAADRRSCAQSVATRSAIPSSASSVRPYTRWSTARTTWRPVSSRDGRGIRPMRGKTPR